MPITITPSGPVADFRGSSTPVIVDLTAQTSWDGVFNEPLPFVVRAIGSNFNDTIYGNIAPNLIDGGSGGADQILDYFDARFGADLISYGFSQSGVIIDLTAGVSWDGRWNDTFTGFEYVLGSNFDDTVFGSSLANLVDGGSGGADRMTDSFGLSFGADILSYAASQTGVIIDMVAGVSWDGRWNDTFSGFENILGSSFDDRIAGDSVANVLDGGSGGADVITDNFGIASGEDVLSYASSLLSVIVDMPAGISWDGVSNDTFSGIENVLGSGGDDRIYADRFVNVIDGGTGGADLLVDSFGIAFGADTLSYASSFSGVIVDMPAGISWDGRWNDTFSGFENVRGSSFADKIYGNIGVNVLDGGNGGADLIADSFGIGFGSDTLTYTSSFTAVIIDMTAGLSWDGVVNDTFSGIEDAVGSSFADRIYGDSGVNVIDGGNGGADLLVDGFGAASGADTLSYFSSLSGVIIDMPAGVSWDGAVNDTFSGFENARGSSLADFIYGDGAANTLEGGFGNDSLFGQGGADVLVGGGGDNILVGDGFGTLQSVDTYGWEKGLNGTGGRDTITNFTEAGVSDKILLKGYGISFADLAFAASGSGSIITFTAFEGRSILVEDVAANAWSASDFLFT